MVLAWMTCCPSGMVHVVATIRFEPSDMELVVSPLIRSLWVQCPGIVDSTEFMT